MNNSVELNVIWFLCLASMWCWNIENLIEINSARALRVDLSIYMHVQHSSVLYLTSSKTIAKTFLKYIFNIGDGIFKMERAAPDCMLHGYDTTNRRLILEIFHNNLASTRCDSTVLFAWIDLYSIEFISQHSLKLSATFGTKVSIISYRMTGFTLRYLIGEIVCHYRLFNERL